MSDVLKKMIDAVLELNFLEGHRTTVIGAAVVLLNVYQAVAVKLGLSPLGVTEYTVAQGILIERLAHFSKKHKE